MQEHSSVPVTNPFIHESEVLASPAGTVASPASTIDSMQEADYFTAKAVPIRASVVSPAALLGSYSPSPFSARMSAHDSVLITPSQFPPPPGHAHPSVVFRKPPSTLLNAGVLRYETNNNSSGSSRSSRASRFYTTSQQPVLDGRESVMSATPSLFPRPPSANGKDAHIRPLFTRDSSLTLSTPGPTPPPKEDHPTALLPMTSDYFSPLAPTVTSVQSPLPAGLTARQPLEPGSLPPLPPPPPPPPPATAAGITRITKPVPLDLVGSQHISPLLPPPPPSRGSPEGPVLNLSLSPLTIQTLTHLSNTALRSPNLTFVEPQRSGRQPAHADPASPLTSAQRDRLREMKKMYDERRGRYEKKGVMDEERGAGGGGGWMARQGEKGGVSSVRTYLWVGIAISVLALAGIVGLVVAVTLAQDEK